MWACEKYSCYLCGESFRLITDHRPLVPLFNQQDLDKVHLRCPLLLMRLMRFKPKAEYLPGKELAVDDTPFQHSPSMSRLRHLTEKMSEHICGYNWNGAISINWEDGQYQVCYFFWSSLLSRVFDHTVNGWPNYAKDVPKQLRPYHAVHGDLSVADDKIINRNRLVISRTLQSEVLERIYDGQ